MKNAIVGQSGGPTAVINSSLAGVYECAKKEGITVYGMRYGIQGFIDGQVIKLSNYIKNDLDIELMKRTPSSILGTCRYRLPRVDDNEEIYEKIFKSFNDLNIGYFFYIGGNDSMDTVEKLSEYGRRVNSDICFIGIPKTIDNDLFGTDHTPGFGSAAKYIGSSVKEIIRDAETYIDDSVSIVEIMGRNAGWLTASSILSKNADCYGPDFIYIPEKPFSENDFLVRLEKQRKVKKHITVAISEGVRDKYGNYVCQKARTLVHSDAFGHKTLGGVAGYLSDIVGKSFGIKSRQVVFSTLQRCASHIVSRTDITEAYGVGAFGVRMALEGKNGVMVTICRDFSIPYQIHYSYEAICEIANKEKLFPLEWINDDDNEISQEFNSYVSPLIIGELSPFMADGMPRHMVL